MNRVLDASVTHSPVPRRESGVLHDGYGMPRMALVALFILAAGVDVRTSDVGIGGPASNPLEIVVFIGFALLLADTVMFQRQPYEVAKASWNANPFLVCYGLWGMVAAILGLTKLAMSFFVFRNLFPAFAFFSFLSFAARQPKDLRVLFLVFLAAALPNIVLATSQYLFDGPYPIRLNAASAVKMDLDGSFVSTAVSGLFNHPNGLSIFLLPVFITALGISVLRGTSSLWIRVGTFVIAIGSGVLLYLTRAKGAWAWGVFGVFVLVAPPFILRFRRAWLLHIVGVLIGIAGLTVGSLYIGKAFKTMQTRINLWESTWYAIENSGFTAMFGSGQFDVWLASAKLADLQYANAHNVFLNQIVYFGIPAGVLYVGAFVWAIREAQKAYAAAMNDQLRQTARIALAVLLAVAGQYFFEPAAESSGLAVEVFFFMGIAAAASRMSRA